jgi:hypothetical protein
MTDNLIAVDARVNHSRWIAECATPDCTGAERVWPGGGLRLTKDGRPYGITVDGVLHCANCGRTTGVVFPTNRRTIQTLLSRRPVPETRNWQGEPVEVLMVENELHEVS